MNKPDKLNERFRLRNDLAVDLRAGGCAVCNHVIKTARDFFAQWQYAISSNEEAQRKFAAELGFCSRHFWQLHDMSSAWGGSVGLAALTEEISRLLSKTTCDETAGFNVGKIPRSPKNCRICMILREAESAYVNRLGTFVSDEQGAQSYKDSGGVCLRHLARMLAVVSKPVGELLLTTASRRFEEFAQQMRNYAAKREAVRRDLITADEEYAYFRALVRLAGAEDYSAYE
jgi:hypothetical protein